MFWTNSGCNDGNLQSVSGIETGKIKKIEKDAKVYTVAKDKIIKFPKTLKIRDAFFIQLPHKSIAKGSVITITTSGTTNVSVGFEYPGDSGGFQKSLPNSGWTLVKKWKIEMTEKTLNKIYRMRVNGSTSISLPKTKTEKTAMIILAECASEG